MILLKEWRSHIKKEPKYKQRSEAKREEYLKSLDDIDISKIHYVDETGSDNKTVPTYGWSLKGEKSYSEQLAFYTERTNMVAAYRYHDKQLIAPFEYKGSTDSHLFCGWFEQCLCPNLKPGDYVIMDNALFHKGEDILEIAQRHDINIIYLPAYSPDLNPIEKFWANFKRNLRKIVKKYKSFQDAITFALRETLSG